MGRGVERIVAGVVIAAAAALLPGGCGHRMIDTPYVAYGEAGRAAFARVPEPLRTPEIPVVYVTDREATTSNGRGPVYTHRRSQTMSYGIAHVSPGKGATWEQLVEDSVGPTRSRTYASRVVRVEELGTFSPTVKFLEPVDGRLAPRAEAKARFAAECARLDDVLARFLDHSDRKEAVVFIHGYNNTFDDAVIRLAEAWHFSGRQGVPIVYTWPAGSGGLKGYAYDRESGEFTIVHLKLLLAALATNDRIERVHIVSHSRGTDVAVTTLRELHAECRGMLRTGALQSLLAEKRAGLTAGPATPGGLSTRDVLKIETLVLAAPDLDLDVFAQRFFGENLLEAANRTVVYFSEGDQAIDLADWLFRSRRRVGAMRLDDFTPETRAIVPLLGHLELINCRVTGYTTHSYVMQHPAALSDLILLLRNARSPGAESGRPLSSPFPGVWELDNSYLKPKD